MSPEEIVEKVTKAVPNTIASELPSDRATIEVEAQHLLEALTKIKNDPALHFDMLLSHTAVDWVAEEKFELSYQLYSTMSMEYLLVLCHVPRENPVVPTVCKLWKIAEWQEREVYDLFGVLYDGHPDLRRLLLEDEWEGFPMRKDYKDEFMLEPPQ